MSVTAAARGALVVFALLSGCGEGPASPSRSPVPAPSGTGTVPADPSFPDLQAFRSSAFWSLFGADGKDAKRLVDELRRLPEQRAKLAAVVREQGAALAPSHGPGIAELVPQVPLEQRWLYAMVPSLMAALEPLWNRATWTEDELALAREVSTFLHTEFGAPQASFAGASAENAASLRRLGAWFRDEVDRVDRYAAMTMTMDDGPFVGVPWDAPPAGRPVVQPLRGTLRVEAWKVADNGEEVAIFAGRRGEETLWCRRITRGDGTPYARVRIDPLSAEDLGARGWRINFSAGGEHAHLYVGPDGRFLFYFVSW